ncbi:hypothetical protein ABG067_006274 [Albugo candida]
MGILISDDFFRGSLHELILGRFKVKSRMTNAINSRYKYAELKQAQGFCADRAMKAIQSECKDLSEAQNEIFRAHVKDLCASIFCSVIKQYNPIVQEDVIEPADNKAARRVSQLQEEIQLKKENLQTLRKNVLKMIQTRMECALESGRKRTVDNVVDNNVDSERIPNTCTLDINAIEKSFTHMTQKSQSISTVVDELKAVTEVVGQAIKRPKTSIDEALATSPPQFVAAKQKETKDKTTNLLRSNRYAQLDWNLTLLTDMNNPFQDPSVLRAQSPTMEPSLDPQKFPSYAPPASPPISSGPHNQWNASQLPPSTPLGNGVNTVHRINLIEELGTSIKSSSSDTILRVMRFMNMLLASATIAVGVLAWIFGHVNSFQKCIAGIYIIMFGALLLAFELRTEKIDLLLRENFGFMYGNSTRTFFLVFIAIWPLSMGNFWLTILDASLLFVNAFFNYFVISQHPAFSKGAIVYNNVPQSTTNADVPIV